MASQLIPVTAPQPAAQNPLAAFAQPSPYLTLGDMLSGFGQGLLSQGPSPVPLSPFAGLAAGIGGAQQGIQLAQQQNQMRQQNILNRQVYQKGQQDLASGNLSIAQTLMKMNYLRQRQGLPPLTQDDLANNPALPVGGPSAMSAPSAPAASTPSAPSDPSTTAPAAAPGASASGAAPISTASFQGAAPSQAAPAASGAPQSSSAAGDMTPDLTTPEGREQIINDGLFIDPKFGRLELQTAQAMPRYVLQTEMAKQGMVLGPDGKTFMNADGTVASKAQVAGAVAAVQDWAAVGPTNAQNQYKASITPAQVTQQVGTNPDGSPKYAPVNTNQLAAATTPSVGAPVVDPTNVAQTAQLAGAAAGAIAQAQVGPHGQEAVNRAAVIPAQMTVTGSDGNQYTVNTSALVASQGGPKVTTAAAVPGSPTSGAPTVGPGASLGKQVLTPTQSAIMPDLAKGYGTRQLAGQAATDTLAMLGELRTGLDKLPTGPGTGNINDAAAGLARIGLDINQVLPDSLKADPTKYAIAKKNVLQLGMALARQNFPGGRITNTDVTLALSATPNFQNNPAANKVLLDNIESIARLKIERSEFDNKWLNSGKALSPQMETAWTQHVIGMKGIPDVIKQGYLSYSDQDANPTAPTAPKLNLPLGAINFATGSDGNTYYQYKNKTGGGFYTGDANGNPVK